jgi:glucose-1-phosphate cytidylyltransferase
VDVGWINGGFMVMNRKVFDYIEGDNTVFEKEPLETLVQMGELSCYKHYGFWQCMDTLRDKRKLEELWETGVAPWKVWE